MHMDLEKIFSFSFTQTFFCQREQDHRLKIVFVKLLWNIVQSVTSFVFNDKKVPEDSWVSTPVTFFHLGN
jgi:hypothetical protein